MPTALCSKRPFSYFGVRVKKSIEQLLRQRVELRRKRVLWILFFVALMGGFALAPSNLQAARPAKILLLVSGVLCLRALHQNWQSEKRPAKVYICEKCSRVKMADGKMDCGCNGHFAPLSEMEWIDSSVTKSKPASNEGTHGFVFDMSSLSR